LVCGVPQAEDCEASVTPDREIHRPVELARALSGAAEAEQEATLGIEHADVVRLHVGHDQPTERVLGDPPDSGEEVRIVAVDVAELEVDCALVGGYGVDRASFRLAAFVGAGGGCQMSERHQEREPGWIGKHWGVWHGRRLPLASVAG